MQNDEKIVSKRTNSFNESTKGKQTWPPLVTIPIKLCKELLEHEIEVIYTKPKELQTKL
jgi:hypothetical protein